MEEKWHLGRACETCSECGREIEVGKEVVSSLTFTGLEFERRDFCSECWETVRKEDLYSHWRTKVAPREEKAKPRQINLPVLQDLFSRLVEEKDAAKDGMTFLIGMILVQKRILKYREVRTVGGRRVVVLGRPRSKVTFAVADPGLKPEEMKAMGEQLQKVLEHGEGDLDEESEMASGA